MNWIIAKFVRFWRVFWKNCGTPQHGYYPTSRELWLFRTFYPVWLDAIGIVLAMGCVLFQGDALFAFVAMFLAITFPIELLLIDTWGQYAR